MSKIDDFDEAEAELLKDGDAYEKEIKGKLERRMLISNFLESQQQSKVSRLGAGQMLSDTS